MGIFRGTNRTGPYFEGWYLKHQNSRGQTLALIPALHIDNGGRRAASLQVISNDGAWWLDYPEEQLEVSREPFRVRLGRSTFDGHGIDLDIQGEGLALRGALRYGPFTALRYDIMGPFRLLAGMQCSHGVVSMGHSLSGTLELNGRCLDFSDGVGYIETDRGRSFPSKYLWTQCIWKDREQGSLMLAIAAIPLPVKGFTGCICSVLYRGREYRLATYLGARIESWSSSGAVIRQGRYRLEAQLLKEQKQALRAPVEGRMERTIHESLCAEMRYRFWAGEELVFQRVDEGASFEWGSCFFP